MQLNSDYLFLVLSGIATFLSYFIYFRSVVKGDTKPHIVSWFIWWLISFIIFTIQIYDNAWIWAFNIWFVAFLCFFIAFISFKKWNRKISKWDSFSLIFWILSIILWIFSDNPFLSVLLLILVDIFWFLPTILKSIQKPFEETETAYFLAWTWYFLSIFAMNNISFLTIWFVVVSCFLNFVLAFIIFYRKRILKNTFVLKKST